VPIFRVMNRYVGNLPPMPGVLSGLSRASRPQRRRRTRADHDALGHAPSAACGRPSRHRHPQHHFAPLARLVKAGKSLPGTVQQLRRIRAGAEPAKKKDVVWFALNDDRPLTAFAGVWTEFKGDRGTKSKPIPGPHLVYGFLTTAPNAIGGWSLARCSTTCSLIDMRISFASSA
jgi:hypothetical protein